VLGFDNSAKRALFEKKTLESAQSIEDWSRKIRNLKDEVQRSSDRALQCQRLVDIQWIEIDVAPLLDRVATIDRLLQNLREGNIALREFNR